MSPLVETIKLDNGRLCNMDYHHRRYQNALLHYFKRTGQKNLNDLINIPDDKKTGTFRCRVIYSPEIESIGFTPYTPRKITTLKLIEANGIDYRFKYLDRSRLQELFSMREDADDILIIKNSLVTDSFTANVLFYDGNSWFTPDRPLLEGTMRACLLDDGKISVRRITVHDLKYFSVAGLINAFQGFEDMPLIEVKTGISW